ncbi:hypothetical protein CDA63_14115 [Hymenobacter amundsenii]|uniref:Uncharacterized protein n=2 Tax=Hymenobacter amundsenii TaxID=2006685 RepID=A0A246FIR6_9BACT|nr:hypothetical protein CDA63_14115 [Hymenobacter amundsenii]
MYASTYLYRMALNSGVLVVKIDVLNACAPAFLRDDKLIKSLQELRIQFIGLLSKESIPAEAVKTYKLFIEVIGNRPDVVDIQCKPIIVDWNDKVCKCAPVREKYPEPV